MIRQRLPQKETLDKSQPRDNFQTPNYATELLIPFIPKNIKFIWECACGNLKITNILKNHNYEVISTDIIYELVRPNIEDNIYYKNFILHNPIHLEENKSAIITNPPYSIKRKFFQKCLELDVPFALLISGDYSLWTIDAIRKYDCEKIVPDRRIDYITPTGLSGESGHTSYFHSYWLTRKFDIGKSETFITLTKEMKKDI